MIDTLITGISHVSLKVKDIQESLDFYKNVIGMIVTEDNGTEAYLRGYEEDFHHSIMLSEGKEIGLHHFAFWVNGEKALNSIMKILDEKNLGYRRIEHEKGVNEGLLVEDPSGFPVEFVSSMKSEKIMHQDFITRKGGFPLRLDHVTVHTQLIEKEVDFYARQLGFIITEEIRSKEGKTNGIFLTRKGNTHDLAVFRSDGPAVHHIAIQVRDVNDIIRVCDILGYMNRIDQIEFGPGRHRATNGLFIYLRDPNGYRVELFTGDYMVINPNWQPIVWEEDPRRLVLWGHIPPPRFREKTPVIDPITGKLATQSKIGGETPISL
ncbi:VOC family protein [Metallosphaera javensis (ex Sakai et al. 2022)]|uniref:VOC family protein n=1 Tax=Metallosphaera javensis (ex Sakai et al. 2022) TaxID=2775498 RepID=UPI00258A4498|nr:MAG: 3,4-dihydroxyphenylacetate 2,3-dioxygenase [Metallosphaera javensis (ex Sakai et al. 2022)]